MRRLVTTVAAAAACYALAACGSQIDPSAAGRTTAGGSSVVAGGPTSSLPSGTGAEPGTVPQADAPSAGGVAPPVEDSGTVGDSGGVPPPSALDQPGGAQPSAGAPPSAPGDPVGTPSSGSSHPASTPASGQPSVSPSASAAAPAGGASCDGFQNTTGITDDTITIGNASDVSGPVPGLFTAAQQAVAAYFSYFNASGQTICGRKLALKDYDSKTDATADQQNYTAGCDDVFAMVGSTSAFDNGGAAAAQGCGLPDIRSITTTAERTACTTCYAVGPGGPKAFENSVPDFIKRNFHGGQKAAMLYLNAGAAATSGQAQVAQLTKRGMKFVYVQAIDTTEFNYAPYAQAIKDHGVETVQFVGAVPYFVRLAQALQQAGYHAQLIFDPTAYDPTYTSSGGDAVKGTIVYLDFTPFEEASSNRELSLYLSYLQQVSPGATPSFFGLFAWSAAELFTQQALKLGGKLTRASLVASLPGIDNWTGNGLHAPEHVGAKTIPECWRFIEWNGSAWTPLEGTKYQCDGTTS